MKKKTAEKPQKTTKSSPTQYTIDLDLKGILFFIVLAALTGVVVFYLGILFGKASRDPNIKAISTTEQPIPQSKSDERITSKDLEIYNIREEDTNLSDLKKNTQNLLQQADQMLSDSSKPETPTTSKPATATPLNAPKPASTAANWPEKSNDKELPKDTYTLQVFATKDKDKANRIVRLLRQQDFDAYLAQVEIENQTIYRVRVGKKPKKEIETIDIKLQKVIGGMGMKSRIIKLN